jgi:hypothetical protein
LTNAWEVCQGQPVGFANPALYSIAGSGYASNFNDVVNASPFTGAPNNDEFLTNGGLYPVGPGYDMTTGLGSMSPLILAYSLCGGPPAVTTGAATSVKFSSAKLTGSVNPLGSPTSYQFQYGPNTNYAFRTPTAGAGSGTATLPVSAAISGLSPKTTYHFRIVALRGGTPVAYGADRTFTTLAAPDTTPPYVLALASSGRRGYLVRLYYHVRDNSGVTRDTITVYQRTRQTKVIATAFGPAVWTVTYYVNWRAPLSGTGFRFCVRSWDRAGNRSNLSCAPISLHP